MNKPTQTKPNCQTSVAVATRVPLLVNPVRCYTIYHLFLHSFTEVSIRLPDSFPLALSTLLASSAMWRSQLLSASSLCHLVMKYSAASTTPRYHLPPFSAAVGHSTVSNGTLSVDSSVPRNTLTQEGRLLNMRPSSFLVGLVADSPHQPSSKTYPD